VREMAHVRVIDVASYEPAHRAPATTSEAKCFCAAIRAALTIPARLYAVMPTILWCLYSWSSKEAVAQI